MGENSPSGVSRRAFVGATATGAAGLAMPSSPAHGTMSRRQTRPNIVLLLTDQHSASAMSCVGSPDVVTPNFDRLAARGTLFTESYVSDPACFPSRAGIFTGRHTCEHGVLLNPMTLLTDYPDLGSWLSENSDYDAVYMGKWHILGRPVGESFQSLAGQGLGGTGGDMGLARTFEGFLNERTSDRPFVAVVSLVNPHDICIWVNQYNGSNDVDPSEIAGLHLPVLPPNFHMPNEEAELYASVRRGAGANWTREKWRYFRWAYFRYVEMVDAVVGRVLDTVWNSEYAADTAIICTSDHGEMGGEHRLTMKGDFYDAAARVPMMVSWPGELPEGRIDRRHLVSGLDVVPTICDLAGIDPPPDMRGDSLLGLVDGSAGRWRNFLQVQSLVEGRMIRTADYKYVTFRDDPVEQLFNMKADPWELNNLAEDPAHMAILEDHRLLQDNYELTLEHTALADAGYDAAKAVASGGG
jgi:arylsulfatase A-like enzyme